MFRRHFFPASFPRNEAAQTRSVALPTATPSWRTLWDGGDCRQWRDITHAAGVLWAASGQSEPANPDQGSHTCSVTQEWKPMRAMLNSLHVNDLHSRGCVAGSHAPRSLASSNGWKSPQLPDWEHGCSDRRSKNRAVCRVGRLARAHRDGGKLQFVVFCHRFLGKQSAYTMYTLPTRVAVDS